jgi:hypothetical protein
MLDIFTDQQLHEPEANGKNYLVVHGENEFSFSSKLGDLIEKIEPGKTVHWVSAGDWSMHEMLVAFIAKTGPADVIISSYAFSETPTRVLASLIDDGLIKSLTCIIDSRVDTRSASALAMLRNCADDMLLTATHAKVTIVEGDYLSYAIVGSANYTVNKRFEAGIITDCKEAISFHKKWINDAFIRAE